MTPQSVANTTYLLLVLFDFLLHDDLLVVDGEENLGDSGLRQAFDLMAQKWLICEFNQWLGHCQGQGTQSISIAAN